MVPNLCRAIQAVYWALVQVYFGTSLYPNMKKIISFIELIYKPISIGSQHASELVFNQTC